MASFESNFDNFRLNNLQFTSTAPEDMGFEEDNTPKTIILEEKYGEIIEPVRLNCKCMITSLNLILEGHLRLSNYKIEFIPSGIGSELPFLLGLNELVLKATTVPYMDIYSCINLEVSPLTSLSSMVSGSSNVPVQYATEITTKDVRRLTFIFSQSEARNHLHSTLRACAFFGHKNLSAQAYAFHYYSWMVARHPIGSIVSVCMSIASDWQYSLHKEFDRLLLNFNRSSSLSNPPGSSNNTQNINTLNRNNNSNHPCPFYILDQTSSYDICPTYPQYLIMPSGISIEELKKACLFRGSQRLPTINWICPKNGATLARCAQPKTGITAVHDENDEKLVKMIWALNPAYRDSQSTNNSNNQKSNSTSKQTCSIDNQKQNSSMLILDARSLTAARANMVRGGGYEAIQFYGNARIHFANIANIHAVRNAFLSLSTLCSSPERPDSASINDTKWIHHIQRLLEAAVLIAKALEDGQSTLIHCSDGWDRTAQLSALVQIILDPYFRTASGFCILIQKEWISYGHKFGERLGLGHSLGESDEASPVFLQWMDAIYQIMNQNPTYFEFNQNLLISIIDVVHSGRFGTFLANCEKETKERYSETASYWPTLEKIWKDPQSNLVNTNYDPSLIGTISVDPQKLGIWEAFFHRYNVRLANSLNQITSNTNETNENQLEERILQLLEDLRSCEGEKQIWSSILSCSPISSELRRDFGVLDDFFRYGVTECQVELKMHDGKLSRCLLRPNSPRIKHLNTLQNSWTSAISQSPEPATEHPVVKIMRTSLPESSRKLKTLVQNSDNEVAATAGKWAGYLWNSATSFVASTSLSAWISPAIPKKTDLAGREQQLSSSEPVSRSSINQEPTERSETNKAATQSENQ